ncbi:MAG TPA: S-methyl-5-thioribose-1-phosphate isomerase [Longimicrobiales bacterium]|nr:S-methyl-5-thioribose-1-phosphate isomerase [Longimicrobiales bacterium]
MRVAGVDRRTIWDEDGVVRILDQTRIPQSLVVVELDTLEAAAEAIRTMRVRGAPLIGATAAYGLALAARRDGSLAALEAARALLVETRPTAVNLRWALDRCMGRLRALPEEARAAAALEEARALCEEDVETNRHIGVHAWGVMEARARDVGAGPARGRALRILTHCNAGWLATVDVGTATAGIYRGHDAGFPLHVWVDETRPRGQGGRLTAWELGQHGVPHTVIPDVAAPHLMATGQVDLVMVGTDRTTARGDVVNKIGTYGVALAARDNGVPFWVAAPASSLDFGLEDGRDVPIEERSSDEVAWVGGAEVGGRETRVRVIPGNTPAANFAFDVTPARLVTGIVTEHGVAEASAEGLARLFPERARSG